MKDRRELITGGVGAISEIALGAPAEERCVRPGRGPNADYFPNVVVHTHQGQRALFYDDLLTGRTVLVHCMSIATEPVYRSVERLARVQPFLGDRRGREVFIYSLTVDPQRDTPRALRDFAERIGVRSGWLFLTGAPTDMELLRSRLFVRGAPHHHSAGPGEDCSMGLARYGNAAVGLWGSVPAQANPEWIARRLAWVQPRERPAGPPRRRGPGPQGAPA
ncbi:MAG TPA: SCO family protein [Thermoanaerobaculia bacterium]